MEKTFETISIAMKRLEESDGNWYVTETLPLEEVISNLSDNPTFKLETLDSKPKISFNINLSNYSNTEAHGFNEYKVVRVITQLSSNDTFWATRMWVTADTGDAVLNQLALEVVEKEAPDIYRISGFSEIVDIVKIAKHYGTLAAIKKKYGKLYVDVLEGGFQMNSISRQSEPEENAPLIYLRGTYGEDVSIAIRVNIFEGSVSVKYKHKNQELIERPDLPRKWHNIREKLLGSNSDPNSIANSLRLANFLDDRKAWSESSLISELISLLDIKACKTLKNVV